MFTYNNILYNIKPFLGSEYVNLMVDTKISDLIIQTITNIKLRNDTDIDIAKQITNKYNKSVVICIVNINNYNEYMRDRYNFYKMPITEQFEMDKIQKYNLIYDRLTYNISLTLYGCYMMNDYCFLKDIPNVQTIDLTKSEEITIGQVKLIEDTCPNASIIYP
jgi:two-component SAPR family response regulator